MSLVLQSALFRDEGETEQIPSLVGPFVDQAALERWIERQKPLWGSYIIAELTAPEDVT